MTIPSFHLGVKISIKKQKIIMESTGCIKNLIFKIYGIFKWESDTIIFKRNLNKTQVSNKD